MEGGGSRRGLSVQFQTTTKHDSSVRPQTEVFLEIQNGGIRRHLEGIWEASGGSGKHLEASGKHLEASGNIWRHLGSIWKHPDASGKHLEASGRHLEHLKASGSIWEASGSL